MEEKIKRIEKLLIRREASYKLSMQGLDRTNEAICYGGTKALKDVLHILKEPRSTLVRVNAPSTKGCAEGDSCDECDDLQKCLQQDEATSLYQQLAGYS